ncbi:MAG: hypothetical protein O7D91_13875 [Planctomycetota bacterium]|nr:hypothetical protein [Planctomycetota bacterium]
MRRRGRVSTGTTAGLILAYEITDRRFRPVLDLASKGERGWKLPVFLKSLIDNPSPLLLHERWLFDEAAVEKALDQLRGDGVQGAAKLKAVFGSSNRFQGVEVQELLSTSDDVDRILGAMRRCDRQDYSFSDVIKPLETAYGRYAWPNNFEFERMNAGIIHALSMKYPGLTPLDDTLRAPVYEYLETEAYRIGRLDQENLTELALASEPPLALPRLDHDWDPSEFVKLHKSKGADQLREIVSQLRGSKKPSARELERLVDRAKATSESLGGGRQVVYAFAGLGAMILSAATAIVNPLLYVPSACFAVITAHQFGTVLKDRGQAARLRWLPVAEQIAQWTRQGSENGGPDG